MSLRPLLIPMLSMCLLAQEGPRRVTLSVREADLKDVLRAATEGTDLNLSRLKAVFLDHHFHRLLCRNQWDRSEREDDPRRPRVAPAGDEPQQGSLAGVAGFRPH